MTIIRPYTLAIPQASIDALHKRLDQVRWPDGEVVNDWSQGTPLSFMRELCHYWRHDYDWRRCESRLNSLGQSMAQVDGLDIHFLHVRSSNPDALPMILSHGWPGSVIEFLKVIGPLTEPQRYGGNTGDAFHLVIPSLPGFGFSGHPKESGWGIERIANTWASLMAMLGYDEFVAQGGDWGAAVTTAIGQIDTPSCKGIHLNMPFAFPSESELSEATTEEKVAMARFTNYQQTGFAYALLQATSPQTLGYALADSPVGQAAWIVEKLQSWSDCNGNPWSIFSRDEVLDNVMLYWLGNSGVSSARLYWESLASWSGTHTTLAWTGCSIFPQELFKPSRRWVERQYPRLTYWNEVERGGHFAALEQPELFVSEMRRCFAALR